VEQGGHKARPYNTKPVPGQPVRCPQIRRGTYLGVPHLVHGQWAVSNRLCGRRTSVRYDPNKHRRRSIRLQSYDYTQAGAYFVTICTQHRECLLGAIVEGDMVLNDAGCLIQAVWQRLPQRFPTIELGAYGVMPNHFHAIVILVVTSPMDAPSVDAQAVGASLVDAPLG
jgi:REP element-mobilizing transposase RayT